MVLFYWIHTKASWYLKNLKPFSKITKRHFICHNMFTFSQNPPYFGITSFKCLPFLLQRPFISFYSFYMSNKSVFVAFDGKLMCFILFSTRFPLIEGLNVERNIFLLGFLLLMHYTIVFVELNWKYCQKIRFRAFFLGICNTNNKCERIHRIFSLEFWNNHTENLIKVFVLLLYTQLLAFQSLSPHPKQRQRFLSPFGFLFSFF